MERMASSKEARHTDPRVVLSGGACGDGAKLTKILAEVVATPSSAATGSTRRQSPPPHAHPLHECQRRPHGAQVATHPASERTGGCSGGAAAWSSKVRHGAPRVSAAAGGILSIRSELDGAKAERATIRIDLI